MKTLILMLAAAMIIATGCKPEERNEEPVINVNAPRPTNYLTTNTPPGK